MTLLEGRVWVKLLGKGRRLRKPKSCLYDPEKLSSKPRLQSIMDCKWLSQNLQGSEKFNPLILRNENKSFSCTQLKQINQGWDSSLSCAPFRSDCIHRGMLMKFHTYKGRFTGPHSFMADAPLCHLLPSTCTSSGTFEDSHKPWVKMWVEMEISPPLRQKQAHLHSWARASLCLSIQMSNLGQGDFAWSHKRGCKAPPPPCLTIQVYQTAVENRKPEALHGNFDLLYLGGTCVLTKCFGGFL